MRRLAQKFPRKLYWSLTPFIASTAIASTPACDIEYRFDPVWETPDTWHFEVRLSFPAGERTRTRIRVVSDWGGVPDFHRAIREVAPAGRGHDVAATAEPNVWLVSHPAGGRVDVRYRFVNDVPNVDLGSIDHREAYRNMLGARHFQFFGYGALVQPEPIKEFELLDACLDFSRLPSQWSFASSHGLDSRSLRKRTTLQALRSAVYVGGDFRIHRREVAGRPLFVAMRGSWSFEDAAFVDAFTRVVASHRTFWGDYDFPYFLMTLLPNRVPRRSTGGTALHNSFAMHASEDFALRGEGFDQIVTHEHLHTWVPRRLGTMGQPEAGRYWFSEGFTNYLTHRLALTSGMSSLEDYARDLNAVFSEYWLSDAFHMDNAKVAERFWTDRSAQRIPYTRGELVALLWAQRLRHDPGGLDGVLRSLRLERSALPSEADGRPEDLAVNRLAKALREKLGEVVDKDIAEHVAAGRPIAVGDDFLGPCFVSAPVTRTRWEAGFDMASLNSRRIAGVVAGSAADKAGLRAGMEVAGWSIYGGDPAREVEIQVREEGRVRTIKYLPVGAMVAVPQFRVKEGAREDAACRRFVAPA
jgi:predicted metalloprotease with PDZ domain